MEETQSTYNTLSSNELLTFWGKNLGFRLIPKQIEAKVYFLESLDLIKEIIFQSLTTESLTIFKSSYTHKLANTMHIKQFSI